VPVRVLEPAFLVVLGLAVAATAQITGVLLVFALLVAPAAAAQELTPRVWLGLASTAAIALAVTWTALILAYYTDYPVGFFVTSIGFAAWVAASLRRRLC
jgi:zinc/manganese transport system permease protein